jgi:hypothetical protein
MRSPTGNAVSNAGFPEKPVADRGGADGALGEGKEGCEIARTLFALSLRRAPIRLD